jgi:putative ABC transport system permease protein
MLLLAVDQDYARVYNIILESGIFLSREGEPTPGNVVLNESAARLLGWENPVGKTIHLGAFAGMPLKIVGMVKDFHFESLKQSIDPLVIAGLNEPFTRSYRYFSLKLNTKNPSQSIASIGELWSKIFPEAGFEYKFMDDDSGRCTRMKKNSNQQHRSPRVYAC